MTAELYDYEFRPWAVDGDRRIVAGGAHSGRVIDGRTVNQLPEVTS